MYSLKLRHSREVSLGFGTIKVSSWRCSGLLPGVSPVFDRTETVQGKIFSPLAGLPELSLEVLPSRELSLGFGTIKASSWRCSGLLPRVYPVFDRTETILGEIFSPLARLPQLSLEAFPPREQLSGSVPSRHLLGAVAVYYRESPQYSIVQKLFWGKSFPTHQAPRAVYGSASPPRALSRVRYHQGIFLAL